MNENDDERLEEFYNYLHEKDFNVKTFYKETKIEVKRYFNYAKDLPSGMNMLTSSVNKNKKHT